MSFKGREFVPTKITKTKIVRIRRKNGKIIQNCDVYIGRACYQGGWKLPKSKWANPYKVSKCESAEEACRKYRVYLLNEPALVVSLSELCGKTLGCWCKPGFCHGDVLVELANLLAESN